MNMKMREIGKSGIRASAVGLGTFAIGGWFWGGSDEKDSIDAIHASIANEVNLIDTAPIYGYGLSEEIVGRAIRDRRDKVVLATKTGLVWDDDKGEFFIYADDKGPTDSPSRYTVYKNLRPESIGIEIENSLRRLGTDYIDLYQTHWQDATTPVEVTMEKLLKLKDEGKIRAIGVSNITVKHLEEYGDIASVQEKFSLIDRGIAGNGILDYCVDQGIAVLSYYTMEQGLLTGKMSPDRIFPEGDTRKTNDKFSPKNIRKVNDFLGKLGPYADSYGCTIPQIVIALTAAQRGITHLLIGARNRGQAVENVKGGAIELSPEDIEAMNKLIEKFLHGE